MEKKNKAAIIALNSVNDTTNPSLVSGYMPGDSCIIAFNTIVNCEGGAGISLGFTDNGSNTFQPLGITIANNLVKMTSGQAAYNPTTNTSLTYTAVGNIYSCLLNTSDPAEKKKVVYLGWKTINKNKKIKK